MNVGPDGRAAPQSIDGISYLKYVGIQGRVGTKRSWRVMRPEYGLDNDRHIGSENSLSLIVAEAYQAISDIDPEGEVTVSQMGTIVDSVLGVTP